MAELELDDALDDCISRLALGQTISDCLPYYPQYAEVLRSLLETGSLIEQIQPDSVEVAAARERVRARIHAYAKTRPTRRRSYGRLAVLVASLLVVFASALGFAENSLPGDALYSVKRLSENARSMLIGQEFGARRLDEIRTLEALKRAADVVFRGEVEEIRGTQWHVGGLVLEVPTGTPGASAAVVGQIVEVQAQTIERGSLLAVAISALDQPSEPLMPTATPTPSPTPRATAATTAACVPSKPDGWVLYIIGAGDTVSSLALMTGTTTEALVAANCIPATLMIIAGQPLFLPMLPQTPMSMEPTTAQGGIDDGATPPAPDDNQSAPTEAPHESTIEPTDTEHHHEDDSENEDETSGSDHEDA